MIVRSTTQAQANSKEPFFGCLSILADVSEGRDLILEADDYVPKPALAHLKAFHRARLSRAAGAPLFGEALPWLFGDFLNVTAHPKFRTVARGWLAIYYAISLIDDVLDRSDSVPSLSILTSSVLIERGISDLLGSCGNLPELKRVCDEMFFRCSEAAFEEIAARRGTTSVRATLRLAERKCIVANICFEALAQLVDVQDQTLRVEESRTFVEQLMLGMQLLDDLCDWPEDLGSCHSTYPLLVGQALTSKTGGAFDSSSDPDGAFFLLIQTGAISDTLRRAKGGLRRALLLARRTSTSRESLLVITLDNLILCISSALRQSNLVRRKILAKFPLDRPMQVDTKTALKRAGAKQAYVRLQTQLEPIRMHT
jgi:hypothetical protein